MLKLPPDITFVIQLVGFVVFWQLMRIVIFTPMQRALKERSERTSGARARAEALVAEKAQLDAAIESGLADARREATVRAEEIRRRAESEEHAILERYRTEAGALLERERALTNAQVGEARAPLAGEAARLSESVVRRVLGRAA